MKRFEEKCVVFDLNKAFGPAFLGKEIAVERGKKPGFHFRFGAQLMALRRPGIESLLHQIARVGFLAT